MFQIVYKEIATNQNLRTTSGYVWSESRSSEHEEKATKPTAHVCSTNKSFGTA